MFNKEFEKRDPELRNRNKEKRDGFGSRGIRLCFAKLMIQE